MPRRARLSVPGIAWHIIQRGNNRTSCFYADEDYRRYLCLLQEQSREHGCRVHAYVLMTNHVHLLATPARKDSASLMMKHLGQRYVQYINRSYRRTGTLWEGRFRSCLAQDQGYVLACYPYIELNPVRAAMVNHPAEYPWSSYRVNGQGETSYLTRPHEQYLALGASEQERQQAYRELFRAHMEPSLIDEIRAATNGNYVLGNDRFREEVAAMVARRVSPHRPGLPGRHKIEVLPDFIDFQWRPAVSGYKPGIPIGPGISGITEHAESMMRMMAISVYRMAENPVEISRVKG